MLRPTLAVRSVARAVGTQAAARVASVSQAAPARTQQRQSEWAVGHESEALLQQLEHMLPPAEASSSTSTGFVQEASALNGNKGWHAGACTMHAFSPHCCCHATLRRRALRPAPDLHSA